MHTMEDLLLSNKKEHTIHTCNDTEHQNHCAEVKETKL